MQPWCCRQGEGRKWSGLDVDMYDRALMRAIFWGDCVLCIEVVSTKIAPLKKEE